MIPFPSVPHHHHLSFSHFFSLSLTLSPMVQSPAMGGMCGPQTVDPVTGFKSISFTSPANRVGPGLRASVLVWVTPDPNNPASPLPTNAGVLKTKLEFGPPAVQSSEPLIVKGSTQGYLATLTLTNVLTSFTARLVRDSTYLTITSISYFPSTKTHTITIPAGVGTYELHVSLNGPTGPYVKVQGLTIAYLPMAINAVTSTTGVLLPSQHHPEAPDPPVWNLACSNLPPLSANVVISCNVRVKSTLPPVSLTVVSYTASVITARPPTYGMGYATLECNHAFMPDSLPATYPFKFAPATVTSITNTIPLPLLGGTPITIMGTNFPIAPLSRHYPALVVRIQGVDCNEYRPVEPVVWGCLRRTFSLGNATYVASHGILSLSHSGVVNSCMHDFVIFSAFFHECVRAISFSSLCLFYCNARHNPFLCLNSLSVTLYSAVLTSSPCLTKYS